MESLRCGIIGCISCLLCAAMFWLAGCGGETETPPAGTNAPSGNADRSGNDAPAIRTTVETLPNVDPSTAGPQLMPPAVSSGGPANPAPSVGETKAPGASIAEGPKTAPETPGENVVGPTFPSFPAAENSPPSAASAGGTNLKPGLRRLPTDWPPPLFALVLTGEQHGYLEPCGCTSGQSGGLSRRANLIQKLEEQNWNVAALDLGGTVRRSRRQSQIKFETALAAFRDMKYQAVGLGPEELRLGPDYLLSQHVPDPEHPERSLALLAANVVFFDVADLGTPARTRLFSVGGKKVGVTAVVGKSIQDSIYPEGSQTDVAFLDPAEAIAAALEKLKAEKPDLLVLLSHAKLDESTALAEKFPDFEIVVSAGGPEDPDAKPRKAGSSWVLHVGQKGKHAGLLAVYPADSEQRFRFALVELEKDRFAETPRMIEHMRFYQDRLRQEQLAGKESTIRHPSGAAFVGAAKCGECHTKSFAKWSTTGHARAFESLKRPREGDPDHGITRIYDAECLACHVTGWHPQEVIRYEGGFINEEFAADEMQKKLSQLLQGNQCENCHGPGSKHIQLVEAEQLDEARSQMRVTLEAAKKTLCFQCHDLDNDPHFEFDKYWKEIEHPGRD